MISYGGGLPVFAAFLPLAMPWYVSLEGESGHIAVSVPT